MVKNDFWLTSGWHLLDHNNDGHLVPTEDFMRAYFYRRFKNHTFFQSAF